METRLKRRSTPRRCERRTRRESQFGHVTDRTKLVEGLTPRTVRPVGAGPSPRTREGATVTSTDRIPALPGPGTRAAIDARKSTDYEFTATATYGELLSGVVAGLAPPGGGRRPLGCGSPRNRVPPGRVSVRPCLPCEPGAGARRCSRSVCKRCGVPDGIRYLLRPCQSVGPCTGERRSGSAEEFPAPSRSFSASEYSRATPCMSCDRGPVSS
jgi:hypothetical protein